jgi:hypothetical protein
MSDKTKDKAPIDSSSIPGVRCVMPPPTMVEAETKPAEPQKDIHEQF